VCIERITTPRRVGGPDEIEATRRISSAISVDGVLRRIAELWTATGGADPKLVGGCDALLIGLVVRAASRGRAKKFHLVCCADKGVALESLSGVAHDALIAQRVALDNLACRVVSVFMEACLEECRNESVGEPLLRDRLKLSGLKTCDTQGWLFEKTLV
jgi:hypothetical protein